MKNTVEQTNIHPNQREHEIEYLEFFESDEYRHLSTEEQFKWIESYCEYVTTYTHLEKKVPYIKVWGDEKKNYEWFPQHHKVSISFSLCKVRDAHSGNFKVKTDKTYPIQLFTNNNMMMHYYNRLYTLLERFETERWITE